MTHDRGQGGAPIPRWFGDVATNTADMLGYSGSVPVPAVKKAIA